MTATVRLSIVSSMYRSSAFLEEFCSRCAKTVSEITSSYEIVLVNDGSPDDSLAVALRLRAQDSRIRIVDLSRNFGHHKAMMTGLAHARGELVFLIDCDLEEEPEWLLGFRDQLQRTGADVVYGVQGARKGGLVERLSGAFFFKVLNRLLVDPIPVNVITARLMTRRYVQALVQFRDREVFLAGLWVITGFDQRPLTVSKGRREGRTSYTHRRRISVLVNAITSFSNRPLIYIFFLGTAVVGVSSAAAGILVIRALTTGIGVPGYASLIVSVWFLGGLTIFSIGVIGVYLAKIFTETKERPYTVVRAEYGTAELGQQSQPPAGEAAALGR